MYPASADCTLTPTSIPDVVPDPTGVAEVDQMLQGADGVQVLRAEPNVATQGSLGPPEEQAPCRSPSITRANRPWTFMSSPRGTSGDRRSKPHYNLPRALTFAHEVFRSGISSASFGA